MNDKVSYNFSYNFNFNNTSETPVQEKQIAFDDCLQFTLPEQRVLLRSKHSGKQTVVTQDVLYSLMQCTVFRTLSEHIRHLETHVPELQGAREEIRQVLVSIQQAGLMICTDDKAASIQPAPAPTPEAANLCVCILTCNRPQTLQRLLESMAKNHPLQHHNHYYVIDDSRNPEHQASNQGLCSDFSSQHLVQVKYFGPEQQQQQLQNLIAALPEHEEGIRFLLDRFKDKNIPSYGRSRNWAMLLAGGDKLVVVDDDILFERIRTPLQKRATELSSTPRSADFFLDEDEWQTFRDSDSLDPAAGSFISTLGLPLNQALSAVAQTTPLPGTALETLVASEYAKIQADSPVLLTSYGYAKDPGTASNDWIYQLSNESRQKLLQSKTNYQQHLQARNLWLGSPGYTFRNHFSLMSGFTGLATQHLLPPCFPLYRNEDFLFGEMLHSLHPTGLFLDMPWAVPHLPEQKRQWNPHSANIPPSQGLSEFSADMLYFNDSSNWSNTPSKRLQLMAQFFNSMGQISDQTLLDKLTQQTLQMRTAHINRMTEVLEDSQAAPDYWQADLRHIIETNEKSLISDLPSGFSGLQGSAAEQHQQARQLWTNFSKGIAAWEACIEQAKNL